MTFALRDPRKSRGTGDCEHTAITANSCPQIIPRNEETDEPRAEPANRETTNRIENRQKVRDEDQQGAHRVCEPHDTSSNESLEPVVEVEAKKEQPTVPPRKHWETARNTIPDVLARPLYRVSKPLSASELVSPRRFEEEVVAM